ncbi:MAG TPA: hypothetical protein VLC08_07350, partial [Chitinolyticbacter sp.]|nr:hypothetical protein [Chitinolyticbacter sp.]
PLLAALQAALPVEKAPEAAASYDAVAASEACRRLKALLRDNDIEASDLLDAEGALLRSALAQHFAPLAQAVMRFDFPVALAELEAGMQARQLDETG